MATNNYYGFTHGGTQYGNQYTPSAPPSTGYTTAQYGGTTPAAPPAQPYPPAGGNDPYVIGGYTRPVGQVQASQAQQPYYGQTQSYPPPIGVTPTTKPTATATPRPAASSTTYPTYSANTASSSYAGFTQPVPAATNNKTQFTNYDQAVYNAVTAYAQGSVGGRGGGQGFRRGGGASKMKGARAPPKPQTLHYCDVCKISCAGPQTYKEHLEGQKHKKKEAAAKVGNPVLAKGAPPGLRCELCDVTCTGNDAYAAHIRGAKHQKVLKLHTKLGKPIPSDNPTVVSAGGTTSGAAAAASLKTVPTTPASSETTTANTAVTKSTPPKINFIGPKTDTQFGTQSTPAVAAVAAPVVATVTTHDFTAPVPGVITTPATLTAPASTTAVNIPTPAVTESEKDTSHGPVFHEKEIQPVGQDYIEEVRSEDGKIVSFNCKLCECRFNDPNAKEMHMKGRRHRLQYKKKVNPDLVVDVKPSSRQKKIEESRRGRAVAVRGGRAPMPAEGFPRGPPVPLMHPGGPRGFGPPGFHAPPAPMYYSIPPLIRRNDTPEDLYVMAKHSDIYPQEDELQAIQKIVSNTEKALKFVSDQFLEQDSKAANGAKAESAEAQAKTDGDNQAYRLLRGVMRVGHLAKGLLLRGDRTVELAVLCAEKPTLSMLNRIAEALPQQLQVVAPEDKYEVLRDIANSGLVVASTEEPKIEVVVTLTSVLLRGPPPGEANANQVKDDPDLLDKEKCLAALAALRHTKWFQARVTSLQSCVILIRIFRDIIQRVPEWNSFPCYAVELLTEKVISRVGVPVSPGDGFRLILEAIAAGILLPASVGLLDPCEKEQVDALRSMTPQQRNDVTAFAQKALRMLTFRKVHEVLGMEPLQRFSKKGNLGEISRKRRRNESAGGEAEDMEITGDGKKDKKEEIVTTAPAAGAAAPVTTTTAPVTGADANGTTPLIKAEATVS